MKDLKLILTACGCPGASTLIRMLRKNGERSIEIIGIDMDKEAVGKFLCDSFYVVPAANSEDYIPSLVKIIQKENPDVLFPESSFEVLPIALHKEEIEDFGVEVVVSSPNAIELANNKYLMYEAIRKQSSIELPSYYSVESYDEFLSGINQLGYPENPIVFKPQVGKGSRGVRIMDNHVDRKVRLMEMKPNNKYLHLSEFSKIFKDSESFPKLLVMEYLDGLEVTSDTISKDGRELLTTVKSVEKARWGVITNGELVKRPDIVDQTQSILKCIPLSYCSNIQFIGDKLIEINPRVSTFIYQDDLIAPYLAIKLALGEITEEELIAYKNKIAYGRRMLRYMDQLFYSY